MRPKTVKPKKDLTPKSTARVTGGGRLINDNITLMRGKKPVGGKKDLPPRSSISVKGGGKRLNDNVTLVRASSR
jgi:hypothetical protein